MNLILTGNSLFMDREETLEKYLSIHPYMVSVMCACNMPIIGQEFNNINLLQNCEQY